jgi:hypothetical protein
MPGLEGDLTVRSDEQIPSSYKTWAVFLISNPEWLVAKREADLKSLYEQFQAFGRAIGRENLAIWFVKGSLSEGGSLRDDTDVERCIEYVSLYGLHPSHGPHVLVTSSCPRDNIKVSTYYVMDLNRLSPRRISRLFAELSDVLVAQKFDEGEFASIEQRNLWNRAITLLSAPVKEICKYITLTITTGDLSVKIAGREGG